MPDKGEKKVNPKKKVGFKKENEIRSYSNDSEKVEYRKPAPMSHRDKLPGCDINKLKKFPCVYRGITFDTKEDILEYLEETV